MSAGFRAVVELRMDAEDTSRFTASWPRMAAEVATAHGCLGQWLFAPTDDVTEVVIMSDWVDEEAFRTFEAGPVHAAHRALITPVRTGGRFRGLRTAGHQQGEAQR